MTHDSKCTYREPYSPHFYQHHHLNEQPPRPPTATAPTKSIVLSTIKVLPICPICMYTSCLFYQSYDSLGNLGDDVLAEIGMVLLRVVRAEPPPPPTLRQRCRSRQGTSIHPRFRIIDHHIIISSQSLTTATNVTITTTPATATELGVLCSVHKPIPPRIPVPTIRTPPRRMTQKTNQFLLRKCRRYHHSYRRGMHSPKIFRYSRYCPSGWGIPTKCQITTRSLGTND